MTADAPPDLRALALPGAVLAVRVTPGARREGVLAPAEPGGPVRILVRAPPEGGRATRAASVLLAAALGVAPGRLELVRGTRSRDKLFRLR